MTALYLAIDAAYVAAGLTWLARAKRALST